MIGLRWIIVAVIFITSGCANTPQIPLPLQQVQSLKVTAIEVDYAPNSTIAWSDEEAAFAKSKGYVDAGSAVAEANATNKPSYESLVNSPESKQHQKALLLPRVKAAFEKALADKTTGTQAVKVVVTIKVMSASPAAQCGAIGGARWIEATASIVDAAGKKLATYDDLRGAAMCAGVINAGVLAAAISASQGDPIDVLTSSMAENFKKWLTPKAGSG